MLPPGPANLPADRAGGLPVSLPPPLSEKERSLMSTSLLSPRQRNLLFFRNPRRWRTWPFLPLVRRRPGREEELGLLFDAVSALGLYGYSATVFSGNLFEIPPKLDDFLSLPREVFDTPEEVFDAGWCVD